MVGEHVFAVKKARPAPVRPLEHRPYLMEPGDPAIDVRERVGTTQRERSVSVRRRRIDSIATEQACHIERKGLLQVRSNLVLPVVEVTDDVLDDFVLLPCGKGPLIGG